MTQVRTTAKGIQEPTFLELPVPPSVNAMWKTVKTRGKDRILRTRRVASEVYTDWQGDARRRLREQAPPVVSGRVLILVNLERTSELADVDNRIKATFDLLVSEKVITDDRFVLGFAAAWAPPANGLMRLAILPAADLAARFHLAPDGAHGGWFFDAPQQEDHPQ